MTDDFAQPEYTDQTPPELIAAAIMGNAGQGTTDTDSDGDTDGDDGPHEGAEQVDPENVPESERMPNTIHEGDSSKAGDDLAGDEVDDSWLTEESA